MVEKGEGDYWAVKRALGLPFDDPILAELPNQPTSMVAGELQDDNLVRDAKGSIVYDQHGPVRKDPIGEFRHAGYEHRMHGTPLSPKHAEAETKLETAKPMEAEGYRSLTVGPEAGQDLDATFHAIQNGKRVQEVIDVASITTDPITMLTYAEGSRPQHLGTPAQGPVLDPPTASSIGVGYVFVVRDGQGTPGVMLQPDPSYGNETVAGHEVIAPPRPGFEDEVTERVDAGLLTTERGQELLDAIASASRGERSGDPDHRRTQSLEGMAFHEGVRQKDMDEWLVRGLYNVIGMIDNRSGSTRVAAPKQVPDSLAQAPPCEVVKFLEYEGRPTRGQLIEVHEERSARQQALEAQQLMVRHPQECSSFAERGDEGRHAAAADDFRQRHDHGRESHRQNEGPDWNAIHAQWDREKRNMEAERDR